LEIVKDYSVTIKLTAHERNALMLVINGAYNIARGPDRHGDREHAAKDINAGFNAVDGVMCKLRNELVKDIPAT
jgi:hypothetical protein